MRSPAQDLSALVSRARKLVQEKARAHPSARVRLQAPLAGPALDGQEEEEQAAQARVAPVASRDPQPPFEKTLWAFEAQIRACERCALGKSRRNFVFGEGRKDARLLFIGEAPGADEDRLGRPFVGAAGQLLTRIIQAMGFKREDVYICNILKCRPPQNRNPEAEEVEACSPFVEHQVGLVKPEVVVSLGRYASQTLLGTTTGISRLRGQWAQWKGIPVMPTFHPSALLRDPGLKRHVWDDMKLVMKKLENPES